MQIEHLRYLVAAVQYGSQNKAAKALYCTQPTITTAIRSIEKELGFPVIERTPSGVTVTVLGKRVYDDACLILGYVDEWKRFQTRKGQDAPIELLFTGSAPSSIILASFYRFQQLHPNTRINARYMPYSDALQDTQTNSRLIISYKIPAHVPDTLEFAQTHGMQVALLQSDEFLLFANSENELVRREQVFAEDLRGSSFIFSQNPYRFPYLDLLSNLECTVGPQVWQEENIMLSLRLNKYLFSFRPSSLAENNYYVENGLISTRRVSDLPMPVGLYIMYPNAERMAESEHTFIKLLKQDFPAFQPMLT